jgi:hypothetical protein
MITFLDIETIPGQHLKESFLANAVKNFKAPSDLSKAKALADLGITDKDEIKSLSKDDAVALWVDTLAEAKSKEAGEREWLKTSFDGSKGEIVSIAWAIENEPPTAVYRAATMLNNQVTLSDETDMLANFVELLTKQLKQRKPFFAGHYIGGFDLKFIFHRCVKLKVNPVFNLPFSGRHNQAYYDTQEAWAGFNGRVSQDSLCKILGIEGKPGDIDGSKVWEFVARGDVERVAEYNKDDIIKNREIYKRLNFTETV